MRRGKSLSGKNQDAPQEFAEIPGVLKNAQYVSTCAFASVPTSSALAKWLLDQGLDTSDWGSGNTKTVQKLWEEIKSEESAIELWKKADGQLQPVRTTHVLRAKVSSPDMFKRRVFLFNTWQQYGDGRKRIRNGLLSEKLSVSELPLSAHLHDICDRAINEEMERLADPLLKIGPRTPAPVYDPSYSSPLKVVDEFFADHVIEVEDSKSYPRLVTMYHLYTVDIVCTGLPKADFNTLEFEHHGDRKLKYVHAWVWMEWPQIQRYLFEGSSMKERKQKGSFDSAESLLSWLQCFYIDLDAWGSAGCASVEDLFHELEEEESQLEMWGRHDGVPLLMRVLHVLQLKVRSTDPRMDGKFLYHTMTQTSDGTERNVNRLLAKKMSIANFPFTQQHLAEESKNLVRQQLTYFAEPHFRISPENPVKVKNLEVGSVEVRKINFLNHRADVEKSRTFKGLSTLYYLYTCEVECSGLPHANFASLEVRSQRQPSSFCSTGGGSNGPTHAIGEPYVALALNFCWVTWQQCMDMLHSSNSELEEQLEFERKARIAHSTYGKANAAILDGLMGSVRNLVSHPGVPKEVAQNIELLLQKARVDQQENERTLGTMLAESSKIEPLSRRLPPSMLSEITKDIWIADATAQEEDNWPKKDELPVKNNNKDHGDFCHRVRTLWKTSMSCRP
mmetsp:Transcript_68968/g.194504  ORF Transcript_68968/g.194504 Transcript_68968/m.194504 type:complete len:675 (-) Transcript_68968:145-2169(-)